jgi:[FeFe] hydrogenase H-cluster maturation GTPase HydF
MEILPLGPVVITDTPGFDDEGSLGELRVRKTRRILGRTDIAVLVADASEDMGACDKELIELFKAHGIPYLIVFNKKDLLPDSPGDGGDAAEEGDALYVSALTGEGINELKERIASLRPGGNEGYIISDRIEPGDLIILVVPIDKAAPKGRLILPQQQTIRDILDAGAVPIVTRDTELPQTLAKLGQPPKMVITDSQAFGRVSRDVPREVPLTSFSILMARYKGDLAEAVRGAAKLDDLQDGDTVLISEGCTHHRQCEDIGTVKMPNWIRKHTGKDIRFEFTSGGEFPEDLSKYALVVHCGGCMLNEREMKSRIRHSIGSDVPITNYGIAIAHMHGILARSIEPFPDIVMK